MSYYQYQGGTKPPANITKRMAIYGKCISEDEMKKEKQLDSTMKLKEALDKFGQAHCELVMAISDYEVETGKDINDIMLKPEITKLYPLVHSFDESPISEWAEMIKDELNNDKN